MRAHQFRIVVKEEIQFFLEQNKAPLAKLIGKIADQLAPLVEEEFTRSIAKRTGQLQPDERDRAVELLEEAAAFVGRYTSRGKDFDDRAADLGTELYELANKLGAQIRPQRAAATPDSSEKEPF